MGEAVTGKWSRWRALGVLVVAVGLVAVAVMLLTAPVGDEDRRHHATTETYGIVATSKVQGLDYDHISVEWSYGVAKFALSVSPAYQPGDAIALRYNPDNTSDVVVADSSMTENSVIRDAELYRSLVLLAAATTLILLTVRRLRPGHPRAVPADVHRALVRSLLRKLAPPVLLVVAGVEVHYWAELAASRSGSTTWNNTTGIAQVVAILCLPWLGMRAVAMWIYLTSVDGEAPSDARVGTITAQGVRTLLGRRVTAVELSVQGQVWTAETATFVPSPGQNDSFLFPGQAVLVYWRYRRASRPLVVISTTQQPVQLLTGIWRRRTSIRQGNRQPSQVATKATRFTRNG